MKSLISIVNQWKTVKDGLRTVHGADGKFKWISGLLFDLAGLEEAKLIQDLC